MAAWSTRSGWPRPHNTFAVCHIHCPGQTKLPGEFGYLVEAREGGFQFAASRQLWDVNEVGQMRVDHADPDRRLYRPGELDEERSRKPPEPTTPRGEFAATIIWQLITTSKTRKRSSRSPSASAIQIASSSATSSRC